MALTTNFGYTDSVSSKLTLEIPTLSYAKDFSVKSDTSNEVVLTNVTSPLDQPETIRFAIQNIGNVYTGTSVAVENRSVSQRGVQLLIQLNDILRVEAADEGNNPCCETGFDLPISSHIVIKVPLNQYVNADIVLAVVQRNIAALFEENNTSARLNSMLRGALKPSTM